VFSKEMAACETITLRTVTRSEVKTRGARLFSR
jgi:hypothetical protein